MANGGGKHPKKKAAAPADAKGAKKPTAGQPRAAQAKNPPKSK